MGKRSKTKGRKKNKGQQPPTGESEKADTEMVSVKPKTNVPKVSHPLPPLEKYKDKRFPPHVPGGQGTHGNFTMDASNWLAPKWFESSYYARLAFMRQGRTVQGQDAMQLFTGLREAIRDPDTSRDCLMSNVPDIYALDPDLDLPSGRNSRIFDVMTRLVSNTRYVTTKEHALRAMESDEQKQDPDTLAALDEAQKQRPIRMVPDWPMFVSQGEGNNPVSLLLHVLNESVPPDTRIYPGAKNTENMTKEEIQKKYGDGISVHRSQYTMAVGNINATKLSVEMQNILFNAHKTEEQVKQLREELHTCTYRKLTPHDVDRFVDYILPRYIAYHTLPHEAIFPEEGEKKPELRQNCETFCFPFMMDYNIFRVVASPVPHAAYINTIMEYGTAMFTYLTSHCAHPAEIAAYVYNLVMFTMPFRLGSSHVAFTMANAVLASYGLTMFYPDMEMFLAIKHDEQYLTACDDPQKWATTIPFSSLAKWISNVCNVPMSWATSMPGSQDKALVPEPLTGGKIWFKDDDEYRRNWQFMRKFISDNLTEDAAFLREALIVRNMDEPPFPLTVDIAAKADELRAIRKEAIESGEMDQIDAHGNKAGDIITGENGEELVLLTARQADERVMEDGVDDSELDAMQRFLRAAFKCDSAIDNNKLDHNLMARTSMFQHFRRELLGNAIGLIRDTQTAVLIPCTLTSYSSMMWIVYLSRCEPVKFKALESELYGYKMWMKWTFSDTRGPHRSFPNDQLKEDRHYDAEYVYQLALRTDAISPSTGWAMRKNAKEEIRWLERFEDADGMLIPTQVFLHMARELLRRIRPQTIQDAKNITKNSEYDPTIPAVFEECTEAYTKLVTVVAGTSGNVHGGLSSFEPYFNDSDDREQYDKLQEKLAKRLEKEQAEASAAGSSSDVSAGVGV